jgi:hypothetical protein
LGGKTGCAPAAWILVEAGEAFEEEALAPLADNLPWRTQARRDD